MRQFFFPAEAPYWLRNVLNSIRDAMSDVWNTPHRLKDYATADLPTASDWKQGLVYDSTTNTVKKSDGSAWDELSEVGHTHTEADIQLGATDVIVGRASAGAGAAEEIVCTAAGRALLDDATAAAQRTTLGLGTAAVKNTGTSGDAVPLLNGAATSWTNELMTDDANGFALFTADPASYKIARNGTAVEIHGAGSVQVYASGTLMWRTNGTAQVYFYKPIELYSGAEYRIETNTVIDSNRLHRMRSYTVATLPAAGTAGRRAMVTDANATTFASTVAGGGANVVPVMDNGANWIIA